MSLFDPINDYCERSGPGLWDEPLNAFSNIVFFIAAWALYKQYRQRSVTGGQGDQQLCLLIFLVALVGLGSTLFHTFANGLTMLGDVIPIAVFTFTYLWVALQRLVQLSKFQTAAALIAFAAIASMTPYAPAALQFNRSIDYFPCLGALFIIGFTIRKRKPEAASLVIRAASWFTVSILYRSLDLQLCPHFHIGTHFIWHTINGWMLYLLVKAVMRPCMQK